MATILLGPLDPRSRSLVLGALEPLGPDYEPRFLTGPEDLLQCLGRSEGDLLVLDLDGQWAEACLARVAELRFSIPMVGIGALANPDVPGFEERYPQLYFPLMTYLQKPLESQSLAQALNREMRHLARGVIEGLSLSSILQMLNIEGKTCTLRVTSGRRVGFFYMRAGQLINARFRHLEGLEAAVHLLASESPRAEIQSQLHDPSQHIDVRLEEVLMEAMRFKDEGESRRMTQQAPPEEVLEDALPESETGKWLVAQGEVEPAPRVKRRLWIPLVIVCGLLGAGALAALFLRKVAVRIQSLPPGASVILDGRKVGNTPMELSLPRPGGGTLKLESADHRSVTHDLQPGEKSLDFTLEPLPRTPPALPAPSVEPPPVVASDERPRAKGRPKPPPARPTKAQPRREPKSKGDVFDQVR